MILSYRLENSNIILQSHHSTGISTLSCKRLICNKENKKDVFFNINLLFGAEKSWTKENLICYLDISIVLPMVASF